MISVRRPWTDFRVGELLRCEIRRRVLTEIQETHLVLERRVLYLCPLQTPPLLVPLGLKNQLHPDRNHLLFAPASYRLVLYNGVRTMGLRG